MIGIIDIHCHIISDVDDGARTNDESKAMLELAYDEGVRTIIATPHFRKGMFECSIEKIEKQYRAVKEIAQGIGDGMEVLLGCEYYAEIDMVQNLKQEPRYTLAGTSFVLIEFSGDTEFSYMRALVQELVCGGYKPILAHIERYECLYKRFYASELVNLGAQIQLNADSIVGENGRKVKKFCKKIIKDNLLGFIGTDGHDTKMRCPSIAKCANYLEKKMGYDYAKKILIDNPQKIIDEISQEYK